MSCGGNFNGQLGTGNLNPQSQPVVVPGLNGVVQVSSGSTHSIFLKADGTVLTCGSNNYGELALQTSVDTIFPAVVSSLSNIVEISAGYSFSLFLKDDGTVYSSGLNTYGQLGNGGNITTGTNAPSLVQNLSNVNHLAGGASHAIFLQGNGGILATGSNSDGQLGDNAATLGSSFTPTTTIDACMLTFQTKENKEKDIQLFPNPVINSLVIEALNEHSRALIIIICDAVGRIIYQTYLNHNLTKIDFEIFSKGIYFYRIQDEVGNVLQKNKILKN
jgi:alpha-tubulin suppressor-like RCC1 family protein